MKATAIIAITGNGAKIGATLHDGLPGSSLHLLQKFHGETGGRGVPFTVSLKELVRQLWPETGGFIFIMATGIAVRMIAPLLQGKERDPAVVVVDDAGRFAISLLSGHLGGANELACRCAYLTGAAEIITTATDAHNLPSFDMIAKRNDLVIDDLSRVKTLNSLVLAGEEIAVVDPTGQMKQLLQGYGKALYFDTFVEAFRSCAVGHLFVTNRYLPPQSGSSNLLILRPRNLILGIGCNSGTSSEEIEAVVLANLKRIFLSVKSVSAVATAEAKRAEKGLLAFADKLGVSVSFFSSDELNSVSAPSPPSSHAMEAIGAAGVAEPSALLASGGGTLLLRKVKSGNVTLAVAEIRN